MQKDEFHRGNESLLSAQKDIGKGEGSNWARQELCSTRLQL